MGHVSPLTQINGFSWWSGETGQGREGRYSLTSTHHCSQIFTHRKSVASIHNSHLSFTGVSQHSVGGAEWEAVGSEGGHQGGREAREARDFAKGERLCNSLETERSVG